MPIRRRIAALALAALVAGCAAASTQSPRGAPPKSTVTPPSEAAVKYRAARALRDDMTRVFHWRAIGLAFAVPLLAGLGLCVFLWRGADSTVGSAIGAGVVFAVILALFTREWVAFERLRETCAAARVLCAVYPYDLIRYTLIGFIGFVDVAILFLLGLRVEERRRRRSA